MVLCKTACTLLVQEAVGKTWVVYDLGILTAMLICLITYSVYIQSLVDFQPLDTYEVYDSLGGAQARLLLPKKKAPTTYNGGHSYFVLYLRSRNHDTLLSVVNLDGS